jgi:short-subunit dehydrogenase
MKKVVLITGASSGMGKETALLLAQQGFTVYAAARRISAMEPLRAAGIHILAMDVTDDAAMVQGVNTLLQAEGRIDVLINNAGFGAYGALEDLPITDARYQLEVNVFGAARLIQLVLPAMRAQGSGKIVQISSIGGKIATPLGSWYHASKFALEGLSDALRNEVKPFGIDVILIEPGGVQSEWTGIATDSLLKVSGNGAYQPLVQQFDVLSRNQGDKGARPIVIATLIHKAITARKPKTRYVGGYLAKPLLFLRGMLSDRLLDKVLMSPFKW